MHEHATSYMMDPTDKCCQSTRIHRLTLSVQQTDVTAELSFCHIMRSDKCLLSDTYMQSRNIIDIGMGSVVMVKNTSSYAVSYRTCEHNELSRKYDLLLISSLACSTPVQPLYSPSSLSSGELCEVKRNVQGVVVLLRSPRLTSVELLPK